MFKSKTNLILVFAIALILPSYGKAMEICEKESQNTPSKSENSTDNENQLMYKQLLKEEIDSIKEINKFQKLSPEDAKEFNLKIMKQWNEKIIFFKKICIDIVKNDIKKGEPYTVALGLKIGSNNQITMELLPLNNETKLVHNKMLFALKLNPDNKNALQTLEKLNADRVNKAESKSAEAFFPKIVIALQKNPASGASYNSSNNTIYIYDNNYLSMRYIHKLIHEFIHRLQHAASYETGGVFERPLDREKYADLNKLTAIEIEASRKGIEYHPDPQQLLEWLAPQVKPFDQKQNDLIFPYYSPACEYAIAYKRCLKNKITVSDKLTEVYVVADKHYKKRKEREAFLNDWENCPVPSNMMPLYLPILKKEVKKLMEYIIPLAFESINTTIPDRQKQVLDTIPKAKKGVCGCAKYFELKKKFGLIPK